MRDDLARPSYYEHLLTKPELLERHEIEDLRAWLVSMEEDVAMFGAAPGDTLRIARIRRRISSQEIANA